MVELLLSSEWERWKTKLDKVQAKYDKKEKMAWLVMQSGCNEHTIASAKRELEIK